MAGSMCTYFGAVPLPVLLTSIKMSLALLFDRLDVALAVVDKKMFKIDALKMYTGAVIFAFFDLL